uniref:Glycogen debranching enzyme glucanotransferase domain-containing protein n=1 Tax=Meloidogyne floridensis TaxID=298350 RepID=A0A915PA76_9BILA
MSIYVNTTTLVIELNVGEFLETKVFRLEQGWKIHFKLGESLLGKAIRLTVVDTDFDQIFPSFFGDAIKSLDSNNNFLVFECNTFGAYKYQFYADSSSSPPTKSTPFGSGYFTILPQWRIGKEQKLLSVNGLCTITFLTKLLGPLNEWEERLQVANKCCFNVIHLTPVQQLGISNSSYSIAEHDKLNPLFESDFDELERLIRKIEIDWNILTVQDVVWNHAAKNASWLQTHPECAYNLFNSPHLRPAYILDRTLQQFSREISQGKWEMKGIPALINSEIHLNSIYSILKEEIIPKLKLEEFYQIDREEVQNTGKTLNDIVIIQDKEYRRLKSTVDINAAIELAVNNKSSDLSESINLFNAHLIYLNEQVKQTIDGHISAAIGAIMGHISYERVASHGPKKGLITDCSPLVTSYFLQPPQFSFQSWQEDESTLAYNPSLSPHIMAFNGWVMDCSNPLNNFAEFPSQIYLRRELICWGDSVKLNYGNSKEDCPFLWNYMENYTIKSAKIFNGLRIDNCHSTPIHVAEHLLKVARNVRKDLYVVAELFTGNEHLDNIFVNRLGISSLIRGRFVYRYGGDPVGAFHPKSVRPAPWDVAHALFYDQTHDNPSPIQVFY